MNARDAVVEAVLYAMQHGCFFPVPEPKPPYSNRKLIQWGAMRNLHNKVAELARQKSGQEQG